MEEIKNVTEIGKNATEVIAQFYSDIRPIVQPVAKCIGAVLDIATSPILYYSEKARDIFKKRLKQYQKKMDGVKEEDRCEVHPEIGAPIMQVLHYTTNDDIAELFTNLLATASISSMAGNAHPAFVEFIKHLSPDEAKIIQYLKSNDVIPYISLRAYSKEPDKGFHVPIEKAVSINSEVLMMYPNNVNVYLSNLLSLGILSDAGYLRLTDDSFYDKVIRHNHLDEEKAQIESSSNIGKVVLYKGYYKVTDIGKLFICACCR